MSLTGIVRDKLTTVRSRQASIPIKTIEDNATVRYRKRKHQSPKFTSCTCFYRPTLYRETGRRTKHDPGDGPIDKQAYLDQIEICFHADYETGDKCESRGPDRHYYYLKLTRVWPIPDPQDRALNQAEDNTEWNGTLSAWYVPFNTVAISITQILEMPPVTRNH